MARATEKHSPKRKKKTQLVEGDDGEDFDLSELEDQINYGPFDDDIKKRQNKSIDTTNR